MCKYLSDDFSYICCCAENENRADFCPYPEDAQKFCENYEEADNDER